MKPVLSQDGKVLAADAPGADAIVVEQLKALSRYAGHRKVGISLYAHAGCWMEQVEDALRLADRLDRKK